MKAKSVLITGTTSGVGRALLERYAAAGAKVVSVNRRPAPDLESLYPSVRFECIDVRSAEGVEQLVQRLVESAELPELFILNAGVNRADNDESFDLASYRTVIETNLFGALNFAQPLTRLASGVRECHVVAVSSMASYVGNPYGLGYTTSKQALSTCFEVWSRMYSATGLVFQQVMLGPVHTAIYTMENRLPPWMVWVKRAFSVSAADAARAITRFAATRSSKLYYPRRALPLYLAMWLSRSLIPGFFSGRKTLAGKARP